MVEAETRPENLMVVGTGEPPCSISSTDSTTTETSGRLQSGTTKVNIVMLVKDRPNLTVQAIDSLLSHTTRGQFNLTVVDDGSQLGTAGAISSLLWCRSDCVSVRISKSKGIVGLARNLGIQAAENYWGRAELLYLSDNDAYFTPSWLYKLLAAWKVASDEGFGILGGYNHPYHLTAGQEIGKPVPAIPFEFGEIREYYTVGGLSWLLDWKLWDKYGKLHSNVVGVAQGEDWEYTQRIKQAGYRVGAVHPHVVHNCGLTSSFGKKAVGWDSMAVIPGLVME